MNKFERRYELKMAAEAKAKRPAEPTVKARAPKKGKKNAGQKESGEGAEA